MPRPFVFTPSHFIRSRSGVLRHLEHLDSTIEKVTVENPEQIPKDREYIVIVPCHMEISESFLRDTPANVIFIIGDGLGEVMSASDTNVLATQSRKCFYIRTPGPYQYPTFSDRRFSNWHFRHLFYNGEEWESDDLTFDEYFKKAITNQSVTEPDWSTLFERAFEKGLELRKANIEHYMLNAIEAIPVMIKHGHKERDFFGISDDIMEELNKRCPTNVRWVKREDHVFLTISF